MSTLTKVMMSALALLAAAGGGYYTGKGNKEVVIQERVVYKEGKETIVYKDRIVVVTKTVKPDGTVIEETRTEEHDQTTDSSTSEGSSDTARSSKPVLSRWSVGIIALNPWDELTKQPAVGATAGLRTWGEVWIKAGAIPATRTMMLGVEAQF